MKRTLLAAAGFTFLAVAINSVSAYAQTSGSGLLGCQEITQTFTRDTGRGHGHRGTWEVRLPNGYQLTSHTVSRQSANPKRKTYEVQEYREQSPKREGVRITYNVPNLGNRGAAKVFGKGERSWLTLRVTLVGKKCGTSNVSRSQTSPPTAMLKWLESGASRNRSSSTARTARDSIGMFN